MSIERPSPEKRLTVPVGFTDVKKLGDEPSTIAEYEAKGLTGAEPGKWSQNNGTIALVDAEGNIKVWIPKADPATPREVPYEKAVAALAAAGYTKGNFYVPYSNG